MRVTRFDTKRLDEPDDDELEAHGPRVLHARSDHFGRRYAAPGEQVRTMFLDGDTTWGEVALDDDLVLLKEYLLEVDDPEYYPCRLYVEVEDDGRAHCGWVQVEAREDGEPVTNRELARIPVARFVDESLPMAIRPHGGWQPAGSAIVADAPSSAGPRIRGHQPPTARQTNLTDEDLREVARVYRAAERAPTKAVQEHFGPMSRSGASYRVQQARERTDPETGEPFLGPAPGERKAGEIS